MKPRAMTIASAATHGGRLHAFSIAFAMPFAWTPGSMKLMEKTVTTANAVAYTLKRPFAFVWA